MPYVLPDAVSESFDFSLEDGSYSETYIIPYADISSLVGAYLDDSNPTSHGTFTGLICKQISGSDLDPATGKMRVTLTYKSPDEGEDDEDLLSVSLAIAGESLALPKENYEFDTGGGQPLDDGDAAPQIMIPNCELNVTAYKQSSLDRSTIQSLIGKVNNATFYGYATEEALFLGADADKTVTTDGNDSWTISYKFAVRPDGVTWNKHFDTATKAWVDLDPAIYSTGDFSSLGL